VTSKTHLILRALRSTCPLYLMIPVSGVLKLKLRTDAQTDGAKRARLLSAWVKKLTKTISH